MSPLTPLMTNMQSSSLLLNLPDRQKKWVILTVMCVAILEVLDSTIINVALPHMMPALNANQEQITWVLTSYVVASAIMIPLTGFLSQLLGEKKLLLINTAGFLVCSFLCGAAQSLGMMIATRCLQGAFGAALIPLSQSILKQSYPLEQQGKAMAIWGLGIMVAPVLGPTLGGAITEHASWRWVFYINVPICFAALGLALAVLPKTQGTKLTIDWIGIFFMFTGISCLQIFLDQGNTQDWFNSNFILILTIISATGIILFIIRSLSMAKPAVNIRLFSDRNFAIATICLALFCGTQFSLLVLEPIMLQTLFGYTAMTAGLTLIPMGLCSAVSIGISSMIINRCQIKYIIITAGVFCSLGSYLLSTLNLQATQLNFLLANACMGFGMGFFMVPLSVYALANLPNESITDGSGLYSYGRMLGTSIGISLMTTLVTRETQINWSSLGANITPYSRNLLAWMQHIHGDIHNNTSLSILKQQLYMQASCRAYIDAFHLASLLFLLIIPLMLIMKRVKLASD